MTFPSVSLGAWWVRDPWSAVPLAPRSRPDATPQTAPTTSVSDPADGAIPVIAISGVTVERVPELIAAGAHGGAVIGAIAGAPDPATATRAFLDALEGR